MEDIMSVINEYFAQSGNALKEAQDKLKTVGTSNAAQQLHGLAGMWSGQGIERDVITAHVRPRGIASVLPLYPTVNEDPRFGSITGVTATVGSQPSAPCEDAPISYIKNCMLTARLARVRFDTETIDIATTVLKKNRGDMTDYIVRGKLLGMDGLSPASLTEDQMLNIMTKSEMVKVGVNTERYLNTAMWQGTVAGGMFPGLDVQIATGQLDADTQTLCPALDSDIKDFNYNPVGGTTMDITEYLSMVMFYLEYNAESMGLDPVEFVVVMRPELWHELSAVWPVRYNTTKNNVSMPNNNYVFLNGRENIMDRDSMRREMTIDINGKSYRVVTDTGIYEHNSINDANLIPGQYASSIYIVPMTIQGGFPVTYREYLDFRQAQPDISLLRGLENFWTDDGIFSWSITQEKWCYKLHLRTEQRVILRTPHLAGKIQHVKYEPIQHVRSSDPADAYFKDGGVSLRTSTRGYAVWDGTR